MRYRVYEFVRIFIKKNNTKRNTSKKLQRAGMLVAAFVVMGSLVAPVAFAAPEDINWSQVAPTQISAGLNPAWRAAAMSNDGKNIAIAEYYSSGSIYTSTDWGATWTQRTNAGDRSWSSIAMSSDGGKLVAAANNGYVYTSSDFGVTWTPRMDDASRGWSSVASSADGSKLVAVVKNAPSGGYIYTSTDSGAT